MLVIKGSCQGRQRDFTGWTHSQILASKVNLMIQHTNLKIVLFLRYWDFGNHFGDNNIWCFECAWEVANKVGGIYTVIR